MRSLNQPGLRISHGAPKDRRAAGLRSGLCPVWVIRVSSACSRPRCDVEIAKDEKDFRRVYPVQKYTAQTSSAAMVRGQWVLTQQLDSYRSNGREEYGTFRVVHTIRIDAKGPRIVARQIDVLPRR